MENFQNGEPQKKIPLKQAIIVEGKYDKIKLKSLIDGVIITSDGFRIFKDKEKLALIRRLAQNDGIIILTDSDTAGFKLRNFIRSAVKNSNVTNIYIPQVKGREKRKLADSKEGLLGVEGIDAKTLRRIFSDAGVLDEKTTEIIDPITKMDFYNDGLTGGQNSSFKRQELLKILKLPSYVSANSLLDVINRLMTKAEYKQAVAKMQTANLE